MAPDNSLLHGWIYRSLYGVAAFVMGFAQLIIVAQVIYSIKWGAAAGNDPWDHHPDTKTFEWEIPSPPPHYNFETLPTAR